MSMKETARLQRLGAMGAVGIAIGVIVVWAVVFLWLAAARVSTAGVDADHALLIRMTTFFPALAIASVLIACARQLSEAARNWQ